MPTKAIAETKPSTPLPRSQYALTAGTRKDNSIDSIASIAETGGKGRKRREKEECW
jgi:hypothetical protein